MRDGREIATLDGRTVRFYDTGVVGATGLTVFWHHGTPQTGRILEPVAMLAAARGIRVISVARPGYEGSTALVGRNVADAAADVLRIADELGIDSFLSAGASGGGPHALGCAALGSDRVSAVTVFAGIAPYSTDFDWFAGMADPSALRSAMGGEDARTRHGETAEFNEASFIARDWTALSGEWKSLGADAGAAEQAGSAGEVADDVAYTIPWGFELESITVPVLFVQGDSDRVVPDSHATWLHEHVPDSELWLRPGDGHVSVLAAYPDALDWALNR
ncbi:MAG TPA: alpha/beta hydrolase [Galbitalea sp.]|jgi:pimeloyl-ACP methyl ester carboxylesterase|nr:alpha/beta hydrolase [Galbitalea sp.]